MCVLCTPGIHIHVLRIAPKRWLFEINCEFPGFKFLKTVRDSAGSLFLVLVEPTDGSNEPI